MHYACFMRKTNEKQREMKTWFTTHGHRLSRSVAGEFPLKFHKYSNSMEMCYLETKTVGTVVEIKSKCKFDVRIECKINIVIENSNSSLKKKNITEYVS